MQVRWLVGWLVLFFKFFLFVRGKIIQLLNHNTMEEIINKAAELIQPINYEPFDTGYYVVMNQKDEGGSDYCINCIKDAVKAARKYHFEQRQQIKDDYDKLLTKGIWRGKKVKEKYSQSDIMRSMRSKLKEYPAKASFTYEGHDPDFGGGLSEPCSCAECGEPFQCSFTPDLDEANRLLEDINTGDLSDRRKWEYDIAFYHFEYCDDDVKEVLVQVANSIIKSFEGGQKKEKFEKENVA
jgi:hypothetical protein